MPNQSLVSIPPDLEDPTVLRRFLARLVEQLDIVLGNKAGPQQKYVDNQQLLETSSNLTEALSAAILELENAIESTDELTKEEATALAERITAAEEVNSQQDTRLDDIELLDGQQDGRLDDIELLDGQQDGRLDDIELRDGQQDTRLDNLEAPIHVDLYDSTGELEVTTGAVIVLDTIRSLSSTNFSLTSGELTYNAATALFNIHADVSTDILSGISRSGSRAWLELSTDGGTIFNIVPGTYTHMYNRRAVTGQESGSISALLTLSTNDIIRLSAERTSGTSTIKTIANGSRLIVVAV